MLSFAIIVFREALEIALILGVLLAGSQDLKGRAKWIWCGLGLGVLGAGVVALFTQEISDSLEGIGQETFQAIVLLLAAVLIGCTVIWMKRRAKGLCCELKQTTTDIRDGKKPLSLLATVVALSVLRDGSEIILLAHGVAASGQTAIHILLGSALGLGAGAIVGLAMYKGLIRAATKHIFSITSWLLIVVAAGMVSQAFGLLSSVDVLPTLVYPLWDTSSILSERSMLGQAMHVLCGYTARPSAMQILGFLGTIFVIAVCLKDLNGILTTARRGAVALILAYVLTSSSNAHAVDKIYSPIVEAYELEVETRGLYDFDSNPEKNAGFKELIGVGYGFTDRFALEGYTEIEKAPEDAANVEAFLIEGRYQLAEQGEYWIDSGLYLELERDIQEDKSEVEGKILLEKSTGPLTHTLNLIFAREGLGSEGSDVEFETAFKSKYRYSEQFQPGFELFDNLGEIPDMGSWNEQEHSIGPAAYGKLFSKFKYELACLFAISDEAPNTTLRWTFELEFN